MNKFLIFNLTILSLFSFAQTTESSVSSISTTTSESPTGTNTTSVESLKIEKPKKSFSIDLGLETSSNLYKEGAYESSQDTGLVLMPAYALNNKQKLSLKVAVIKEHTGEENTSVSNTELSLSLPKLEFNKQTSLSSSVKAVIPTNKDAIEIDRLKGAAGASGRISYKIEEHTLFYSMGLTKNVHDYTLNGNGSPNISYRLAQVFGASLVLPKDFSIDTSLAYSIARTYQDFDRYSFEFSADINYQANDQLSVNLGTTNGGGALKANGRDSNIAFYDGESSIVRAGLSLSY